MIWLAALLAGGVGLGLWVMIRAWFPSARPLAVLAAELSQPRSNDVPRHLTGIKGWWHRVARRIVGTSSPRQAADLSVVGTTSIRLGLDKLSMSLAFGVVGLLPVAMYPLLGIGSMTLHMLAMTSVLVALGWIYPDLALRTKASAKRKAWDGAIAVFVDVVGISLAGGAGVDDALMDGARAGTGDELQELAATLLAAQTRRRKLWVALEDLGRRHDLRQLTELAAAMDLAGESGSRVRDTLRAKATALRSRQLTDAETEAQQASESMSLAPALLAVAAIVLIAYPAVSRFLE